MEGKYVWVLILLQVLMPPFSLPEDLRDYLANYGITYLVQAQKQDGFSHGYNGWYSVADLDLGGNWDDL